VTARPRRRWRRWAWWALVTIVAARLLLAVFLTQLLGLAAGAAGLRLTMRTASLSLTGMSLRMQDLVALDAAQPDASPLLTAQDLELDLSTRFLLGGEIVVVDAALAGAQVTLRRDAQGRWNLPAAWTQPADAPPDPPPDADAELSFALPARVISARVHGLAVRFEDAAARPPLADEATIDVDVRELGADGPGEIGVRVLAPRWCDGATLQARVTAVRERAEIAWRLDVHALRAGTVSAELAQWAGADTFDTELRGHGSAQVLADAPTRARYDASVRVLAADASGELLQTLVVAGPTAASAEAIVVPFAAELAARGIVGRARVLEGVVRAAPDATSLQARLELERLTLHPLRPVLAAAGVELPDDGVRLAAVVACELGETIGASVHDLELAHAGEPLRLARAAVHRLRTGADGIACDAVEIVGPVVDVVRERDGALRFVGVRIAPPPAAGGPPASPPPPPRVAAAAATSQRPRVAVDKLAWTSASVTFTDATIEPPARVRLADLEVHGERLVCGSAAPPASLVLTASVPDVVARLRAEVTATPRADGATADVRVTANGLTAAAAAPWLAPAGIVPVLRDGTFSLHTTANVACSADATSVDAELRDLALRDGDQPLASIAHARVTGLRLARDGVATGTWSIERPLVAVHHDGDGSVRVAGLHLRGGATAAPAAAPPTAEPPAGAAPIVLGAAALRDGLLHWTRDGAAGATVIGFDAAVRRDPAPGGTAASAAVESLPFTVGVRLDGTPARVELQGRFVPSLRALEATLAASGLRARDLDPLLPPGVRCSLANGTLDAALRVIGDASPRAGASLAVERLRLADDGEDIATIDRLAVALLERSDDLLHVRELTVSGVRATVEHTDGGTRVAGLLLPATGEPAPAAPAPPLLPPGPAEPSRATRVPLLAVDALAVDAAVTVRDRRAGGGEELVLRAALGMQPWVARADAERGEPARLQLTASAAPLCRELRADIELQPFELQPSADVALTADGIDFTALSRVWPQLAGALEGTTNAASFGLHLFARVDSKRHDPRLFDVHRAHGGDLAIDRLVLRDGTNGTTLASVGSIDVDVRAIDFGTGDVLLRSVDVHDVAFGAMRTPHGVELLGLRLLTSAEPAAGSGAPRPPSVADAATAAAARTPLPPPHASGAAREPEFAVDHFQLAGLHVLLGDTTTTPPTLLPIDDGEIELHRFTSRLAQEPRPFAFSFSLRGGDVELARRGRGSALGGLIESAIDVAGGGRGVEQRALFDEIAASGQLQLVPWLSGRIRATVNALELPALRGLAQQGGVTLEDGLLDQIVTIEFRGPDGIDVRSNQVAQHLALSEGDSGAITGALGLGMPLSTVLFLLKNDAGEHTLPVSLHVPAEGMSSSAVFDLAAEAIARQIGGAVSGAASRTLGSVTGIFTSNDVKPPLVVELPFAAGDPLPGAELDAVRSELAGDDRVVAVLEHELGAGDLERARMLATPPATTVAAQAAALRERHAASLAARRTLATDLQALFAAGRMQEAEALQQRLVQHDHATAELGRTLDRALQMLGEDDEHAQRRRTAAAAQALGNARLAAVRAELLRALPGFDAQRLVLRPPRANVAGGLDGGGRVVATLRVRTRTDLPTQGMPGQGEGPRDSLQQTADPLGRPVREASDDLFRR
jgi:hypothetical protein